MFGRKQSSYSLESRLAAHDVGAPHTPLPPEASEATAIPPAQPERPATPRPDPQTYFPPAHENAAHENQAHVSPVQAQPSEAQPVKDANGSLLKLGNAQAVGEAAAVPAASSIPKRRSGRAKTRLLGIDHGGAPVEDVLAGQDKQEASAPLTYHAVGWLVVITGPGRGHSMPLRTGVSQLGRGDDQSVQLDFGDNSISRANHASIAFDEEKRCFFIGHGGKANLVRLNGAPVLSTEPLAHGDHIRIGETTLQLVAFCGETFTWADGEVSDEPATDAKAAKVSDSDAPKTASTQDAPKAEMTPETDTKPQATV